MVFATSVKSALHIYVYECEIVGILKVKHLYLLIDILG